MGTAVAEVVDITSETDEDMSIANPKRIRL